MRQDILNSMEELYKDYAAPAANPANEHLRDVYTTQRCKTDWYGLPVRTGKEAIEILRNGWSDGAKRINDNMNKLEAPRAKSPRRRPVWSDQGDTLDMQRVYCGRLDVAWRRTVRREATGPAQITLVANLSISGGTSAEVLFWRGAAAIKLADILTEAGYSVQIVSAYGNRKGSDHHGETHWTTEIILKPFHAPLDLAAVASGAACAATLRALMFGHWSNTAKGTVEATYGYPYEIPADKLLTAAGSKTLLVPFSCSTREAANRWVKQQVDALNAEPGQEVAA